MPELPKTVADAVACGDLVPLLSHVGVKHHPDCHAFGSVSAIRMPGERCATCGAVYSRVYVVAAVEETAS